MKKLAGRYKGKRKWTPPPVIFQIECPGCGWKGRPGKSNLVERAYIMHLATMHKDSVEGFPPIAAVEIKPNERKNKNGI